ncbi:hypothetical protein EW145_g4160 [Phellinidium pouzarii]|uniref:Spindle assembly checkpoint component MAD1 n=1 Tax=Phellinidium pouzarii TaxID=167371 RepID=A0A4S4L6C8_9AGAM|nr:hypothetical protein EW145_g4160 [Phellinidium pouzarii]
MFSTTSRPSSVASNNATSGLDATASGIKRKMRTASGEVDKGAATAKRPALSTAFSTHVNETSLNRQLLTAQSQITELQNALLEREGKVDSLEADLRLMASREEEEKASRKKCEEELVQLNKTYEEETASLKKRLTDLEADHEDLDDAYSQLSHSTKSEIASLKIKITARDEEVALLKSQQDEADARAQEKESRINELERILEEMVGEEVEEDTEGILQENVDMATEGEEEKANTSGNAESQKSDSTEMPEWDTSEEDDDLDADADGEVDEDDDDEISFSPDSPSNTEVAANNNVNGGSTATPLEDVNSPAAIYMSPSQDSDAGVGDQFEVEVEVESEAYPDPGAPPPYTVSSPVTSPEPPSPHISRADSIASSRAMSTLLEATPARPAHRGTPVSVRSASLSMSMSEFASASVSASPPDPLAHVKRRLSVGTPSRRRLSFYPLSASASMSASMSASRARERDKDIEIVRGELARQTAHLATLEATNARLTSELERVRARAHGAEVLREEKRELERRATGADELRQRIAELEEAGIAFEEQKKEWKERLQEADRRMMQGGGDDNGGETPSRTPVGAGVAQQLSALRRAHATLLDEHGVLKAELRAREVELSEMRKEAERVRQEFGVLQRDSEALRDMVARKEKDRALAEQEVIFLKSLVSSYKSEESTFGPDEGDGVNGDGSSDEEHEKVQKKLEQRVAQLEGLLEDYKAMLRALEREKDGFQRGLDRPEEQWTQLTQKAFLLEEAFNNARAEAETQSVRVETLEQQLFELGGEIGGGRHVPPGTRVLNIRANPAQEWADTRKKVLDRLKSENEALLAQIEELEKRSPNSSLNATGAVGENGIKGEADRAHEQFVPRASYEVLKEETAELHSALAQREKRLLRLQQVFAAKSAEFRDALAALLGLKLAFYPNGQVRITSVYDLSASFVFQPAAKLKGGADGVEDGARMQLIAAGEGGPQELDGLMNTWIRQEMCIPCFMSSVTLECYDKWKNEQRGAT